MVDLRLQVWFEKPSYAVHERITVHASVTNAGTATAEQVVLTSTGNLTNQFWLPFNPGGVTIEPGQTVEGTTTGLAEEPYDAVRLVVTTRPLGGEPDANPDDNTVSAEVPVVLLRGTYRGTIYGDGDGDGVVDHGEGLAGLEVRAMGGRPYDTYITTTDANGTFVFRDLPAGEYWTSAYPTGWYLREPLVNLDGVHDVEVVIRAVPAVRDRLEASVAFTQQSYRPGDVARAVLTLRNTSTVNLIEVSAECFLSWPSTSVPVDVGELAAGVVLPAGTTRNFDLTAPIVEEAASVGHVRLFCEVGAPPVDNSVGALVSALARVPGGTAPKVAGDLGELINPAPMGVPSRPLPGVKLYLRDAIDGTIAARDVSAADGSFAFHDVPAGLYEVGVVGPWQIYLGRELIVRAGENGANRHRVVVQPGPVQPDPDAVPPGGEPGPPPPAAGPPVTAPPLAATGAGVTWLALGGLLSVLTGSALVLGTPRRLRR
jgi:hypothetical protein